ncbi:MAG: alkaline phosphatase family protein [Candidatus Cybelea sp.]
MKNACCYALVVLFGVSACSQAASIGTPLAGSQLIPTERSLSLSHRAHRGRYAQSPIQHVVIIVQENRSVDDLFQFLPGANTQRYGFKPHGNQRVQLQSQSLAADFDLAHTHEAWTTEYNDGRMNGFENETCKGSCPRNAAFSYVPQSQVQPYYSLAQSFTFADNMYETDEGPSFPSHQYLVSGTSTVSDGSPNKASNNPEDSSGKLVGGCDSPRGTLVGVITPQGKEPAALKTFPCFQRRSLMNELDDAGVSWKYYQANQGAGLFNAVDAIYSIWSDPYEMAANVIAPPSLVLNDIGNGRLANVVWVTPTQAASDHPKVNNGSGPSWVGSVVNAIGNSQYWHNTAIFITWDDWGGFYDHVPPTIYNSFELGFRVPLIVVSPYAKEDYVSHAQHEFGSILKFTEETFGLPSLGTTDQRADDLSDCFDFSKPPKAFKRVKTKYPASYFFHLPSVEPND